MRGTTLITRTLQWSLSKSQIVTNQSSTGMTPKRQHGLCWFRRRITNSTSLSQRSAHITSIPCQVATSVSWPIDGRMTKTILSMILHLSAKVCSPRTDGARNRTFRRIQFTLLPQLQNSPRRSTTRINRLSHLKRLRTHKTRRYPASRNSENTQLLSKEIKKVRLDLPQFQT